MSNRRLSQVISADYLRRKYLSQSAVNETKAFYIEVATVRSGGIAWYMDT